MNIRQRLAASMGREPCWMRSYQSFKTVITNMVADGEIERVAPPGGKGRNMIVLTQKGCDLHLDGITAFNVTWAQPRRWDTRPINAARRAKVVELRAAGWSFSAIGRHFGVSGEAARQMWHRARG